jgi:two-component system chemotaxis sensor kinase CheA
MKGEDTELDRQVLELIKDPLTHMVRNAADHGLEYPDERKAAGKNETGTVFLNAYHEGGHIIIEIGDDGKGLDPDKIANKALRNGLTNESDLSNLSEQQILQFVFKPGFSTADKVSAVSGRGVGMDVVRSNIEQIGGTIELSSKRGQGSKFTVKIPLTLAIVSALIVECAGERFAIPQLSVVELVRAKGGSENKIERIKNTPVLRLRDRLLPLVNLRQLLRLDETKARSGNGRDRASDGHGDHAGGAAADSGDGADRSETDGFIVVSQVGTYSFGIIVDQVYDTEEIVVKPVAKILRNIPLFSGNTILGDGRVVMILDPNGVASASGEIALAEGDHAQIEKETGAREEETVSMLVFNAVDKSPKAVPLALVARLEEVDLQNVEYSNGQRVIQYRGHLMPLIQMDGAPPLGDEGKKPVLVFSDQDRTMGLVVDEIVDIVEEPMNVELQDSREGYLGSAVIGGKATDLIDTGYYLTQAFRDWFRSEEKALEKSGGASRVLLIDDSPFFRNLLSPLLGVAGYRVTAVESADAALQLCDNGENFDVIVSDIEMPGMDGYELAETLRSKTRWANVPLIALSSHATAHDMERGRAAGFRDYVAKFDRDTLLDTLHETLTEEVAEERGAA